MGTKLVGDHLSMGTKFDGDRLSRGTKLVGDHLSMGTKFWGTICPWGREVGDRKSGDQMGLGPNASQPSFFEHPNNHMALLVSSGLYLLLQDTSFIFHAYLYNHMLEIPTFC